ncbi:MAG: DUF1573 domain-containing protein [Vicinamibacterales bacterium]
MPLARTSSLAIVALLSACARRDAPVAAPSASEANLAPLVQLHQLVGSNNHLHTDEVRYRASDKRLFHCAYDFGVIDGSRPDRLTYLAQALRHSIPGDARRPGCIHLAWEGDLVYTVHRGNIDNPAFLSGWKLQPDPADPAALAPVQLPVLQEPGVSYEGIDTGNGYIYVALRQHGLGVYQYSAERGFRRVGTASGLSNAWGVRVRGTTAFVSDGLAGLAVLDVADPRRPVVIGRVRTGGQTRGLALDGPRVFVAAGSAGLAVVDVTDPRTPRLVGQADMPGSAIRVDVSAGKAYVAAWNDARVYDVSQPATPRFIGAVRLTRDIDFVEPGRAPVTSRTLGVAAAGDVMFVGNWHVIYSYRTHAERRAPNILLPEDLSLVDFGPVESGASVTVPLKVTNQGTAPLTIADVSTENPAFTVEPRSAHLEPGAAIELSLTYTATETGRTASLLHIRSDDPASPERRGYLVANRGGLSVGSPLPETTVTLVDGGRWSSTEARGQVMLLAYFATF